KGRNAGAVYVFQRAEGAWNEVTKLYREGASAEEEFGYQVALSGTGLLVAGAPGVDAPASNAGAVALCQMASPVRRSTRVGLR
ncbi:MAG TPA: FG-GAP repeat protein, partial [Archangium sp.]|nr:FG-GAP repeat protein [Archangium sp.]